MVPQVYRKHPRIFDVNIHGNITANFCKVTASERYIVHHVPRHSDSERGLRRGGAKFVISLVYIANLYCVV